MRLRIALGASLSALVASAGCAEQQPKPVDFSETTRNYQPSDYETVRTHWTRHGKIIRDVGTVLEVWATYKSWDFRHAYLVEYASLYKIPDNRRAEMREQQLAASREVYEFHVTAQSTSYDWNDLEQRDSPWKITLVDGSGAELLPTRIEVLKLPEMYESHFFPSRTDFTRTYTVQFARGDETESGRPFRGAESGSLVLRIVGPLGRIELAWAAQR
jgi:hypothetical protein